jgi:hypothetical protein
MDITCQKCGKTSAGQHYTFHYGELCDTKSSSQDLVVARVTTQTKTYRIFGEEGAHICDRCATTRLGWQAALICLILGISWAYFGTMASTGLFSSRIGWQPILFCICPGAFLVLVAVMGVLELFGKVMVKADADTGEKAAIDARRKDLSVGHASSEMVFWTGKEYAKLLAKQKA